MTDPTTAPARAVEVTRSEERAVVRTSWRPTGTVRIGKQIVTEERTITVTLRREELFVEHLPADSDAVATAGDVDLPADPSSGTGDAARQVVALTLFEEDAQVQVTAVPRERVRVYVDRVVEHEQVTQDLAREVVEIDSGLDIDSGVDPDRAPLAGEREGPR